MTVDDFFDNVYYEIEIKDKGFPDGNPISDIVEFPMNINKGEPFYEVVKQGENA